MADSKQEVYSLQPSLGKESLDATWNPEKYTASINNPLAKGLISAYSGMRAAQGINPYAGGLGDIQAALAGAAGGIQAQGQLAEQERQLTLQNTKLGDASPMFQNTPWAELTMAQYPTFRGIIEQQMKPVEVADPVTQKTLVELGFTPEEVSRMPLKAAQFIISERGKGERFATGEANKEARLRLKAQLANDFNLDPETSPRTMTDDEGRAYLWTGKNWRLISQRMDKANAGALSDVVSAISGLGNIDTFYGKIDNTMFPQLAQVAGKQGMLGTAASFAFPDVAQARAATTTLFTFAKGGKALTENEMRMIDNLFSSLPYGSAEREAAKQNVKSYLVSQIRATIAGNLTGSARTDIEDMLDGALRGEPVRMERPATTKPKAQPKQENADPLGIR